MMNTWHIRNTATNEEIDYLFLKNALASYANPRDKITNLLINKELIRVKKGLYVFNHPYAQKPYIKESLANLIYGPSCISLQYALSYYGLIPERVEVITSITTTRDKQFQTPVGNFSYRYIHPKKYPIGITQIMMDATHSVIMATPEKALADLILLTFPSSIKWQKEEDITHYLFEDLRIPMQAIRKLNKNKLFNIAKIYQNYNISQLIAYISKLEAIHE